MELFAGREFSDGKRALDQRENVLKHRWREGACVWVGERARERVTPVRVASTYKYSSHFDISSFLANMFQIYSFSQKTNCSMYDKTTKEPFFFSAFSFFF
jgi:hypothetical protein